MLSSNTSTCSLGSVSSFSAISFHYYTDFYVALFQSLWLGFLFLFFRAAEELPFLCIWRLAASLAQVFNSLFTISSAFITLSQYFSCLHVLTVVSDCCCLLFAYPSPAGSVPSWLLLLICSFLSHHTASPLALLAVLPLCSPHLGIFSVLWVLSASEPLEAAHSFQASYLQSTYSCMLFSDKCFFKW